MSCSAFNAGIIAAKKNEGRETNPFNGHEWKEESWYEGYDCAHDPKVVANSSGKYKDILLKDRPLYEEY
jgi:hypothetical protein